MDDEARELVRALRGKRSQVAFSRRLGYTTAVAADWEGGHRFPTAWEMLRAASVVGVDVVAALASFHAPTAHHFDPERRESLAEWLVATAGTSTHRALAARAGDGLSHHQVGRYLRGTSEPRLPEFLRLVDAMTGRVADFVGALVPIEQVPSLLAQARALDRARRLAFEHPYSAALVPLIEVAGDRASRFAAVLRTTQATIDAALDAMVAAGLAHANAEGTWVLGQPLSVEATAGPDDLRRLRTHWASVSAGRAAAPGPDDQLGFNLFAVSAPDYERVRQVHRAAYREIRAIAKASPSADRAVGLVQHLFCFV